MRIVAGSARGRRLGAPPGSVTRPTSDKVRGAIFNLLGQFFDGGAVLDLYAGSGALALEALSRGCATAVCVERDRGAAEVIRKNAGACGFAERVDVRCQPVEGALERLATARFFLAFLDPPYAADPGPALDRLGSLMVIGGTVVVEHDARNPSGDQYAGLALVDRRRYGDTGISIYRAR